MGRNKKKTTQRSRNAPDDSMPDVEAALAALTGTTSLKKERASLRRQISLTCSAIDRNILERGSRRGVQALLAKAVDLLSKVDELNRGLVDPDEDQADFDHQHEQQLRYLTQVEDSKARVEAYLVERGDDPVSTVGQPNNGGTLRQDAERQRQLEAAQQRAEAARREAEEAERALIDLRVASSHSSENSSREERIDSMSIRTVSSGVSGSNAVERWCRNLPAPTVIHTSVGPDDWIDNYRDGREPPLRSTGQGNSAVKAKLEDYSGKALEWFSWIDLFRSLVHDTARSAGEKLAILKSSLKGDCLDVVYGLGGGEAAYIEALVRLKEAFGRRDVMRAAHLQALDRLDCKKGEPSEFKRFAERARTHLFDLDRIGGSSHADVIEKLCLKLPLTDRVAWTVDRGGGVERRTLNEFGAWLCSRAAAYQNAYSIAAEQTADRKDQSNKDSKTNSGRQQKWKDRQHVRTNQASTTVETDDKHTTKRRPFCFNCKAEHRVEDCKGFKEMPVGERISFVIFHRLCFNCLGPRHSTKNCHQGKGCGVAECKFKHHVLLHDDRVSKPEVSVKGHAARASPRKVALGALQLDAVAADGALISATVMLDEGSDSTLVREGFARRLRLDGEPQTLNVEGVGRIHARYDSRQVRLQLSGPTGEAIFLQGSTMPSVAKDIPVTEWGQLKSQWSHLSDLPLRRSGGVVDILLGLDHAHLMAVFESRVGGDHAPVAAKTPLGWVVRGVVGLGQQAKAARVHTVFACDVPDNSLDADFRRFCDTEAFGTEYQIDCLSPESKRAVTMLESGLVKLEVGYQAPITWKEGEPVLPRNRKLAEYRLQGLMRRFARDPKFEEDYRAAVQKYFTKGYAVRVTGEEAEQLQYFLPHHGVYKPRTTKLRVVFDAAAKYQGKCLNDAICSGPTLQNALPDVIIKFREGEVAFTADIEAMFSRIRLSQEDALYHGFLWQEKGSNEVLVCRMDRLPFGNTCSPYIAIHTTRRTAAEFGVGRQAAVDAIQKNLYVDDYLDSTRTLKEAIQRAQDVRDVLAKGDFHLQGWVSNSTQFLAAVRPDAVPQVPDERGCLLGDDDDSKTKVLGVYWKPAPDILTFVVDQTDNVTYTRVGLVSKVAGVYDPLGLASPLIVKAKIRLRELSIRGLDWNDAVTEADRTWWEQWFEAIRQLNGLAVPRCLFPDEVNLTRSELHTFSDASEEAYASAVYLRNSYSDGRTVIRLVMAKSKLAPKKTISVAKLELNAALLGARLASFVLKAFTRGDIKRYYWTDSSCTRNWVRATAAFYKPFVSHRVGEIQTLTEPGEWRFVPGRLNSSDAATRSLLDEEEPMSPAWLNGPDFLQQTEEYWPIDLPWMTISEEIRSCRVHHVTVFDWSGVEIGIADINGLIRLEGDFPAHIERCQEEAYGEELRQLKKGEAIDSSSSLLSFTPFLGKDGLLRLGGRIGKAKLPYDNVHPLLLPAKHPLSEKIITAFHRSLHHAGTDFLLTHIRQHFWIVGGREAVKKIRRQCKECVKETAKPAGQLMGALPEERLDHSMPPFTRTAVDYFGPMEVGFHRGRTAKRYGALFTCLVTRAVYVDLAKSLSTDDFLLVFRRFVAAHRRPESVHSDNGLNFIGAERELRSAVQELQQSDQLQSYVKERGIVWKFQPPIAPHFGGAHESLVRTTKRALYRALEVEKNALRYPTDDMLQTLLFEVSGLLNSRPLTYASSDPDDFRPLTPNDFMNKPPTVDVPPGRFDDALPREHYRYVQRMTNLFWDLWKTHYLQSLASRSKWKLPQRNFVVGDVVLISEQKVKRGQWSVGRIIETFPGDDGLVRVVTVRTEKGDYRRPIHVLCLLEKKEETGQPKVVKPVSGEDGSAQR